MRFFVISCLTIILAFSTIGCNGSAIEGGENSLKTSKLELKDIAFRLGQESSISIYIEENGEIAPYLVIADDYDSSCLLLREYLLDEPMRFNQNVQYAAYYENSEIDIFLNNQFYGKLSDVVKNVIVNSTIDITTKDSLGVGGRDVTTITRNVFLLSYSELNMSGSKTNLAEGRPIEYFSDKSSRIAYYSNGQKGSWWLRTPNTADTDVVCGVSIEGAVGVGGVGGTGGEDGEYLNGVRPAFCLPGNTLIERKDIEGETGYFIKN